MTRLSRSKSAASDNFPDFNPTRPGFLTEEQNDDECPTRNPIWASFIGSGSRTNRNRGSGSGQQNPYPILDILAAAVRKSLVMTCSVERDDVASIDISWPMDVRHVSHVTFDRFDGFLGLPTELEPEVPRRAPSASASVFGVSAESMQCSYDDRGNSVPTILLMMQLRLYAENGLKAEGIFRINPDNSQEENVRQQLNRGIVPRGIDVHCLAGLIKAWFRELPTGILDSLTPEQVMHCDTEDNCTRLLSLLPPMESSLLDWSINLMADVAHHEHHNKMNARNIAMVFAPNMTQMADPLTALIHAVQVMNFLKTLILKTLRERAEPAANRNANSVIFSDRPENSRFFRTTTLCRTQTGKPQSDRNIAKKIEGYNKIFGHNHGFSETREHDNGYRLGLKDGVRRLCRYPVLQLTKPAKKIRDSAL